MVVAVMVAVVLVAVVVVANVLVWTGAVIIMVLVN